MWVEFVVGSRPCSESFSPGSPVFLHPQKSTFLNSNSIGNSRATGNLSVLDCYVLPSLNKVVIITCIETSLMFCEQKAVVPSMLLGSSCDLFNSSTSVIVAACGSGKSKRNLYYWPRRTASP